MNYDWHEIGRQQFDGKRQDGDCAPLRAAILEFFNDELYFGNQNYDRPAYRYYVDNFEKLREGFEEKKKEYLKPFVVSALAAYEELQEKTGLSINIGCGCCDGGYYIKIDGMSWSFNYDDF